MMTLEQSLAVCQLSAIWRGLVRRLICRDLNASSDKAAIDTVCKHIKGDFNSASLFAREAMTDDWQVPERRR